MDPNRAKVSLRKRIKPYIHRQTEYMILANAHHYGWFRFLIQLLCCYRQYSRVVVSRVKKGGTSTYSGKGEVMVDSPEQLITLGIWEYQRIQGTEK